MQNYGWIVCMLGSTAVVIACRAKINDIHTIRGSKFQCKRKRNRQQFGLTVDASAWLMEC